MRFGHDHGVAYYKDGYISGLATGADMCAEHECGIKPLYQRFCGDFLPLDGRVLYYQTHGKHIETTVKQARTLTRNLDSLIEGETDGLYWFSSATSELALRALDRNHSKMSVSICEDRKNPKFFSCWGERDFLIWTWDEKMEKKLRQFFQHMTEGKAAFFTREAPMWESQKKHSAGIHFVDLTRLAYHDDKVFETLQKKQEAETVLYAAARHIEIYEEHSRKFGERWFGYLRPERFAEDGQTVLYFLNPGYDVPADFFGPYTEKQLVRWIRHGKNYQLTTKSPE